LTSIGISAFYGCENIESIKIPLNVTTIEISAFSYCYKLEKIKKLPRSLKPWGSM
jgi:hypothetical protein